MTEKGYDLKAMIDRFFSGELGAAAENPDESEYIRRRNEKEMRAVALMVKSLKDHDFHYYFTQLCKTLREGRLNERILKLHGVENESVTLGFLMGVHAVESGLNDPIAWIEQIKLRKRAERKEAKAEVKEVQGAEGVEVDGELIDQNEPTSPGAFG